MPVVRYSVTLGSTFNFLHLTPAVLELRIFELELCKAAVLLDLLRLGWKKVRGRMWPHLLPCRWLPLPPFALARPAWPAWFSPLLFFPSFFSGSLLGLFLPERLGMTPAITEYLAHRSSTVKQAVITSR